MQTTSVALLAIVLLATVVPPAAAQGGSTFGTQASEAPTPPQNREPARGQAQGIEGTVENVQGGTMTVKTPDERMQVDVSGLDRGALDRLKPGDRVRVVGVMGPEREILRATHLEQAPSAERPEAIGPVPSPERSAPGQR